MYKCLVNVSDLFRPNWVFLKYSVNANGFQSEMWFGFAVEYIFVVVTQCAEKQNTLGKSLAQRKKKERPQGLHEIQTICFKQFYYLF